MRAGATSHNAIAAKLNERNVRTARGGAWKNHRPGHDDKEGCQGSAQEASAQGVRKP
jgi:hypothetical protein